jgi:CubicO group peptidase (beta-lactamase class C family)
MKAKFNEHDIITHSGGIHGFITNAYYFPDKDLYIAIFSNSSNGNIEFLINSFASEVLELLSTASENEADQFNENSDEEIVNGLIESFQRRTFSF